MRSYPFRWSGNLSPVSDRSCIIRQYCLNKVQQLVSEGTYVQVLAPAQYGRTTFALQLVDTFARSNYYLPVLIRCAKLQDGNFEAIKHNMLDLILKVSKEFLPPETYLEVGKMLGDTLIGSTYKFTKALVSIGHKLNDNAFVFIFDDLEVLERKTIGLTFSFMRGLHEHYSENRYKAPYQAVILSIRDLTIETNSISTFSPFNMADFIYLSPVSEEQLESILDENHTRPLLQGVSFSSEARSKILSESGGHPYLVQRICQTMIERAGWPSHQQDTVLTKGDALIACIKLMETGDQNLHRLNNILQGREEWSLCKKLIRGEKIRFIGVQTEINQLSAQGIIRERDGFCYLPIRLYERRLANACFNEQFFENNYVNRFADWQQLLLSCSEVQQVLLNTELNKKLQEGVQSGDFQPGESNSQKNKEYITTLVEQEGIIINIEELNILLRYYKYNSNKSYQSVLEMISQWFSLLTCGI